MTTHHQRTRVIMRVDSHQGEKGKVIDCSPDLIAFNCTKTTKARGRWQATLVPRRNYMNLLFPNDMVNFYIDPGDGESGFVRTMMGYVDRVERQEITAENGQITTRITVIGSDFQKAIDNTFIYFNRHLRQSIDARFNKTDQGGIKPRFDNSSGLAMKNAGITITGTPSDFLENMLQILLGFGEQWQLPPTMSRQRDSIKNNRVRRAQRAKDKIPQLLLSAIGDIGKDIDPKQLGGRIQDIIDAAAVIEAKGDKVPDGVDVLKFTQKRNAASEILRQKQVLLAYQSTLATTQADYPAAILDLLDLDFIESLAIDGFQHNSALWSQSSSTLGQFLYGYSNEIVNELMFDLRPITEGGLKEGDYSKSKDELGINVEGFGNATSIGAVKYKPAVVFREYPHSVVDHMDLNNLTFVPDGIAPIDQLLQRRVYFGPIFALGKDSPGRKIYTYPGVLSPVRCKYADTAKADKHLDVVTIDNTDVKQSQIGRSDEDTFNLFTISPRSAAQGAGADTAQGRTSNFSPVLNQISIARNGMRVRDMPTNFSLYSKDKICGGYGIGGSNDTHQQRRNLLRWTLLIDHWFQHSPEYLSGTITMRARPDIRVGYRLDWEGRNESYYVESVTHSWTYPGAMETTVNVTRGQRNDPFLAYVPPTFIGDDNTVAPVSGNRSEDSRLGKYFDVKDTQATVNSTGREDPVSAPDNIIDKYPSAGKTSIYANPVEPTNDQIEDDDE